MDKLMDPLVSILTPTYNHERFVGECIESVLAQTYENWEMILVDDGSSDHTWDVIRGYSEKDRRIRAFRQQNKGIWKLAETYNFALERSRGELVAVLEGDDLWLPSKLAAQVPLHTSGKYALTFGQIQSISASGEVAARWVYPDLEKFSFLLKPAPDDLFLRLLRGEFFLPAVTVMINRSRLNELNGFRQTAYLPVVDYPTWLSIGASGGGFGFVPEVLAYWRQYSSQSTWLLAREIAQGAYRFAFEFAEKEPAFQGFTASKLKHYLLSEKRKSYIADANYRAAAVSFERANHKQAWSYCMEIARAGKYPLFARCLAMFAWKTVRGLAGTAARSAYQRTSQF